MCNHTPIIYHCGCPGMDRVAHCRPMLEKLEQTPPEERARLAQVLCADSTPGETQHAMLCCGRCHAAWVAAKVRQWDMWWEHLALRVKARTLPGRGHCAALAAVFGAREAKAAQLRRRIADLERATRDGRDDIYVALPLWVDEQLRLVRAKALAEGWL